MGLSRCPVTGFHLKHGIPQTSLIPISTADPTSGLHSGVSAMEEGLGSYLFIQQTFVKCLLHAHKSLSSCLLGEADLKMQISRLVSYVKRQHGSAASSRTASVRALGEELESPKALKGSRGSGEVMRTFRRNSHCVEGNLE